MAAGFNLSAILGGMQAIALLARQIRTVDETQRIDGLACRGGRWRRTGRWLRTGRTGRTGRSSITAVQADRIAATGAQALGKQSTGIAKSGIRKYTETA